MIAAVMVEKRLLRAPVGHHAGFARIPEMNAKREVRFEFPEKSIFPGIKGGDEIPPGNGGMIRKETAVPAASPAIVKKPTFSEPAILDKGHSGV